MAATQNDINEWIETGKQINATHIISVCDTFNFEDYPVYVLSSESLDIVKRNFDNNNMQRINEIIPL